MSDLIGLSSAMIDTGVAQSPPNRVTQELSELDDKIALVESFSHVVSFRTEDGIVCFDSSGASTGRAVVEAIRTWSQDEIHTIVFTHGHVDHVGGSGAFVADAESRGDRRPRVVAHENVGARFDRYRRTDGYNQIINERQFGWLRKSPLRSDGRSGAGRGFLPLDVVTPDTAYRDQLELNVGGLDITLHHARGETDDHTWAWIPARRVICAGDFFIWNFPNAGNPQKVQRYPDEWASALRHMAAQEAELFVPAHGLPIAGTERIKRVLTEVAGVLDSLVEQTVGLMNQGATLDTVLPDRQTPGRDARAPVPAAPLRRTRVRRPQHLASVRWLVRRQPCSAQAPDRYQSCSRGRGPRRGSDPPCHTCPRRSARRRPAPGQPAGGVGRVRRARMTWTFEKRGQTSTSSVANTSRR